MGFTVQGSLDGALYEVEVTGDGGAPTMGSRRVAALVDQFTGTQVKVTPHGPVFVVSPSDPASVLALLSSRTRVSKVGSGAPELVDPVDTTRR